MDWKWITGNVYKPLRANQEQSGYLRHALQTFDVIVEYEAKVQ